LSGFLNSASAAESTWVSRAVSTEAGVFNVQQIEINLESPGLSIKTLTMNSGELLNGTSPVQSLGDYVNQVGGFAGINGSYFCPADYSSCAGKVGSYYWLWYNSLTDAFSNSYQNQFNPGPVVAFDSLNDVHYYRSAEDWPGKALFESQNSRALSAALSNGPGLVFDSELVVSSDQLDNKQRTVKSNRSGLGFKDNYVYLTVASSATVLDLGYIMLALGMEHAINLDGGGSSSLYYNGQYSVGPGRNIPNTLVFIEEEVPDEPAVNGKSIFTYDESLRGGFNLAVGNVISDSRQEIISGTGQDMAPHVRVFDENGELKSQFFAYDESLRNGVTITACDVNNDGYDEIVTGQGQGGWPLLRIFDGYGNQLSEFNVLDGTFTGGFNLSCGDTNGDGVAEVVVAARQGGGPHVLVYDLDGNTLVNFMAYDQNFRGGINVATIDMDGDNRDEIVTGPQYGAPHIQIFQIRPNELKRLSPGFYAFDPDFEGGVNIAGGDIDGDSIKELIIGVGEDATPLVRVYNIREEMKQEFFAFDTNYLGGVQVAGGDVDADGIDEILVMPRSNGGPQIRIIEPVDL